ncbi:MAG: hypothetical protein JJD97_11550 [Gemmatimonadaceae bacterium]|nr:hypothetical protein [Gemmatimonadaceae bacterium]
MIMLNGGTVNEEKVGLQLSRHFTRRRLPFAKRSIAVVALNAGYPLCAVALWMGATYGLWTQGAVIMAVGTGLSFFGWFSLHSTTTGELDAAARSRSHEKTTSARSFELLYSRIGTFAIILASYVALGVKAGWPLPESGIGWIGLMFLLSVFLAATSG